MIGNFNPKTIFDAVLVCGIGLVVIRVSCIVSALVQCLGECKIKKWLFKLIWITISLTLKK